MMWKQISATVVALLAAHALHAAEPPAAQAAPKQASPAVPDAGSQAQPAVNTSAAAAPPQAARRGQNDRLELDTTVVTGNRELPKVLYIVPWKKADLGELPAQPFNTLLDEVLTPVDRDVFRREVTYYDALATGTHRGDAAAPAGAPAGGPAGGSEK